MGRSQISRANQKCRQPHLTSVDAQGLTLLLVLGGGGLREVKAEPVASFAETYKTPPALLSGQRTPRHIVAHGLLAINAHGCKIGVHSHIQIF
jgi:hypothetical protein